MPTTRKQTPMMKEPIQWNLNKENASFKFAESSETEYGWNQSDLTMYGELCRIEGMIEIARANSLNHVLEFWTARLTDLTNDTQTYQSPEHGK